MGSLSELYVNNAKRLMALVQKLYPDLFSQVMDQIQSSAADDILLMLSYLVKKEDLQIVSTYEKDTDTYYASVIDIGDNPYFNNGGRYCDNADTIEHAIVGALVKFLEAMEVVKSYESKGRVVGL